MTENSRYFFIGTLTPDGFKSLTEKDFNNNDNYKTYIVKGGRYTASPKLIEMIADEIEKEGFITERMTDFLDCEKLCGVYFPEINISVFDGNSPYNTNACYDDCKQYYISLSDCMNKESLFDRQNQIIDFTIKMNNYIEKSLRFITASKSIYDDNLRIANNIIDTEKTERFVTRFSKKEFGSPTGKGAKEYQRFLSSFSPESITVYDMTIKKTCPKIIVIEDKIGSASAVISNQLKNAAILSGFDVISCICPLKNNESPEHLIIPGLGLGIFTSDKAHPFKGEPYKKINANRFYNLDSVKKNRARINFNNKAFEELSNQACYLLSNAKNYQDKLFSLYDKYTDYKMVIEIKNKIKTEILSSDFS